MCKNRLLQNDSANTCANPHCAATPVTPWRTARRASPARRFRVSISSLRVSGIGFRFRVSGFRFRVSGFESRASVSGFGFQSLRLWVSTLRLRKSGEVVRFGFRLFGFGLRSSSLGFGFQLRVWVSVLGLSKPARGAAVRGGLGSPASGTASVSGPAFWVQV